MRSAFEMEIDDASAKRTTTTENKLNFMFIDQNNATTISRFGLTNMAQVKP